MDCTSSIPAATYMDIWIGDFHNVESNMDGEGGVPHATGIEIDDPEFLEDEENTSQSQGETNDIADASFVSNKLFLGDGTPVWIPVVDPTLIPKMYTIFKGFEDGLKWYKKYASACGFVVRKATERKDDNKITYAKYFICHKAGLPNTAPSDTLDPTNKNKVRNSTCQRTNCQAFVAFKIVPGSGDCYLWRFVQRHNHELISQESMHLSRANRQLSFYDQSFIHKMSSAKIGPTVAYRLMATMLGGYDYVHGTEVDWKNFMRDMNCYIKGSDAQLLVEKLQTRMENVSNFTYEKRCDNKKLDALFWADDTSKLNYQQFGDVVSFDATYRTNRYCMVFVPFTGIDNHKRCVTFGAGLLCREDTDSYVWLLKAFLNAFGKQPAMVLTDQDAAMIKAVEIVFTESRHRFCMWHITSKLPNKVSWATYNKTDFKKHFSSLVWDSEIEENEFEEKWIALMAEYKLQDNKWMTDMYTHRKMWISAYFKHVPMSGLMRTTSRSESENSAFNKTSHHGYTLMNFMNSFESAMEKQRHNQIKDDFSTTNTVPKFKTPLIHLEKHASKVYTRKIFQMVQNEILHSIVSCAQKSVTEDGDVDICIVSEKRFMYGAQEDCEIQFLMNPHAKDGDFEVVFNKREVNIKCECMLFEQYGILCRHAFCVLKVNHIHEIPSKYIIKRWTRDVIPTELLKRKFKYADSSEKVDRVAFKAYTLVEHCLTKLRTDDEKLDEFIKKLEALTVEVDGDLADDFPLSKQATIEGFYGSTVPEVVDIENPGPVRNKGCGTGKRLKSSLEKATVQAQKKSRTCSTCGVQGHNTRSCLMAKNMANK